MVLARPYAGRLAARLVAVTGVALVITAGSSEQRVAATAVVALAVASARLGRREPRALVVALPCALLLAAATALDRRGGLDALVREAEAQAGIAWATDAVVAGGALFTALVTVVTRDRRDPGDVTVLASLVAAGAGVTFDLVICLPAPGSLRSVTGFVALVGGLALARLALRPSTRLITYVGLGALAAALAASWHLRDNFGADVAVWRMTGGWYDRLELHSMALATVLALTVAATWELLRTMASRRWPLAAGAGLASACGLGLLAPLGLLGVAPIAVPIQVCVALACAGALSVATCEAAAPALEPAYLAFSSAVSATVVLAVWTTPGVGARWLLLLAPVAVVAPLALAGGLRPRHDAARRPAAASRRASRGGRVLVRTVVVVLLISAAEPSREPYPNWSLHGAGLEA